MNTTVEDVEAVLGRMRLLKNKKEKKVGMVLDDDGGSSNDLSLCLVDIVMTKRQFNSKALKHTSLSFDDQYKGFMLKLSMRITFYSKFSILETEKEY